VWLAWCDEALGDLEAAERGVARSVERDGDVDAREWQSIAHAQLARWLADRGRLEPAREHAERADVRPEPSSSAAQWTRIAAGSVAQAAGDRARAVEEFSAIAELDRGANLAAWAPALARARLAELLASEDPPSAQSLAERAAAELERALGSRHPQTRRARAQLDAFREPLVK
jgi:tetratricopeptide (TPR) repeat protein